jgi:hypothetical protein
MLTVKGCLWSGSPFFVDLIHQGKRRVVNHDQLVDDDHSMVMVVVVVVVMPAMVVVRLCICRGRKEGDESA